MLIKPTKQIKAANLFQYVLTMAHNKAGIDYRMRGYVRLNALTDYLINLIPDIDSPRSQVMLDLAIYQTQKRLIRIDFK